MAKQRPRTLRDLQIAARDGDRAAIRALLRRQGWTALAAQVHRGKPISTRVSKAVAVLYAGVGTHDELGPWECLNEATGEIENDLDPSPGMTGRMHPLMFED
jgi:hypothetical protein